MLVLTRRPLETVCIGDNIEVTVVEIRGDRVRLAFDAPREINIARKEVIGRKPASGVAGGAGLTGSDTTLCPANTEEPCTEEVA